MKVRSQCGGAQCLSSWPEVPLWTTVVRLVFLRIGSVNASVAQAHAHTRIVHVPSEVGEIIASEPGGRRRQAITHGRGGGQGWRLGEDMRWENPRQCTHTFIFLTFALPFFPLIPLWQGGKQSGLRVLLTCLLRQIKSLICQSSALMEKALRCWGARERERAEEEDGWMHLVEGKEERILKWRDER